MSEVETARIGVVVIGRNEGDRLLASLRSVVGQCPRVVYVDSGSSDGSVSAARALSVEAVELSSDLPFTAARARNTGFARLLELYPDLEFVQFVDGDCVLLENWLECASAFLESHPEFAVVCGRLRERHPDRSIYNQLCDVEWAGPAGEIDACGGIAMIRSTALKAVNGFRPDLIAGEEPELCVRFKREGWKIWRLEQDMALHDAEMLRFGQWWTRMVRTGYAFAQAVDLNRAHSVATGRRQVTSALVWGLALPVAILILCVLGYFLAGALLALAYPAQVTRLALKGDMSRRVRWANAFFLVIGKFSEIIGVFKYAIARSANRQMRLIEYK